MEIKIGIADVAREVSIDADQGVDDVVQAYRDALSEPNGLLHLTDPKGRHLVVPATRVAYLDLGSPEHRPVGFGAAEQ
ncbi:MAG: DUF3107 domain-containing protein [Propionibacteriaceae bacterium]|nr:DUF3107 domain-containing protein [Propionibacteriaceae bacterium]